MEDYEIEKLHEYAELINDESGEFLSILLQLYRYDYCMDSELFDPIVNELKYQYKYWTENYEIVESKYEQTIREVVEK